MKDSLAGILARLKESLAADRKKTAFLCVLCLVLLIVLARQIFSGSTVEPAAASASSVVVTPSNAARSGALVRPTVEAIGPASPSRAIAVSPSPPSAGRHHPTAQRSEKIVSVEGLARTMSRDIFNTTSWNQFARSSPSGHAGELRPTSLLMQMGRKLAAYGRSRLEEERKIDEVLVTLRLESTMTGRVPLAYISGRLVREGEQVEGFSVVHIRDREVMLRKSGVTRVLGMP